MEDTPDSLPPAAAGEPDESRPYTATDRIVATLGLAAVTFLAYVFMDIVAGGRLTRALSAGPPEEYPT